LSASARSRAVAASENGVKLGDARLMGQRQQPFHFDLHAGLDQAEFGKDRPQGIDLAGIAAIERGEGESWVSTDMAAGAAKANREFYRLGLRLGPGGRSERPAAGRSSRAA
jgi:hypothetical protein